MTTALLSDHELLAHLISFDTVSSRPNAPAADWIADYLDRPGIRVSRQHGPEPGKVNVVARAGGDTEHGGLTLCGHLDVVPADVPDWTTDPFTLVEREGALIGRGSADMKGFCALAVNRLAALDPSTLGRPLALLLTFDEEVGSLGARHFAEAWPADRRLPKSVLVGEPTSLRLVRMHKGHRKLRIVIGGRSAHSGSPQLGVNAVERAGTVLQALGTLRRELESERWPYAEYFPSVPFPVLAVTGIRGGEAENVIPASCELDVGLRVLPGMDPAGAVERVQRAVADASKVEVADLPPVEVVTASENPPLLTSPETPLHRALAEMLGQRESVGVSFASDAGWLATAGYECVLWGPGSIEVAHKPDESLPREEFERAGRLLERLIGKMCQAA